MAFFKRLGNTFDRAIDILVYIGGFLLFLSMLSISVSVISRAVFRAPIMGVGDMNIYSLLYFSLITAPWILRKGGHIALDTIPLRPKAKSILAIITSSIGAILFFFVTWFGIKVTWIMYSSNYKTDAIFSIPKFILISIVSVSLFFTAIQFIRNAVMEYEKLVKNPVQNTPKSDSVIA